MENIDIGIIIAQIINLCILFYMFKRFIADRLNVVIKERRALIKKLDEADERYAEKIAAADAEEKSILEAARADANDIMLDAKNLADQKAKLIMQKAKTDIDAIMAWGRREIEKERLTMLQNMKGKIIDLSLKLNEKMFDDERASKDFMEKEMKAIKELK